MKKASLSLEHRACKAALKLAGRMSWNKVTLGAIAKTAKVPLSEIRKCFSGTEDILTILPNFITTQIEKSADFAKKQPPLQDRQDFLFEMLMRRFDAFSPYRAGISSIKKACVADFSLAKGILEAQWRTMEDILSKAPRPPQSIPNALQTLLLLVVYDATLYSWLSNKGNTSKTMASLGRSMTKMTQVIIFLESGIFPTSDGRLSI